MEKTIFVVQGRSNAGKTTAIKLIYQLLLADVGTVPTAKFEFLDRDDFLSVVIVGDKRVGFISQGDKPEQVKAHSFKIQEIPCLIIICAATNESDKKGNEIRDIIEELKSDYLIERRDKSKDDKKGTKKMQADRKRKNQKFANDLYGEIKRKL